MFRILVIDDQADVRAMIAILLRVQRFEVVEASNAPEALAAFAAASFDLAIVDIFLDGKNGIDVIMALRARVPDLPVVAISGMTARDFLPGSLELADVVCLQKPFRPNQLACAIETARASVARGVAALAAG
ncbi:chemotaxis protein CheY [Bradyrhizobium sp. LTSPM299]|uniref:response regulator n=1 Tax=Bradyrhizobium sp. LTSPM299 TaxID=1619233 RepID=UPI0005C97C0F|nr:response regulator [Bradyrhizobium sp. LTSPM299]KJC62411.1 chemotaxis protein CheY [Bradyrhizobium sp. LTSPM299]